jgi:hypothetical protein
VYPLDRVDFEPVRRDYFTQVYFLDPLKNMFGTDRAFEWRHQDSTIQFGSGIAQGVFFTEYG